MQFGQALKESLKENGQSIKQAAEEHSMDNSTLGRYMKGSRRFPKEVMREFALENDEPKLYVTAQCEVSGGASVPWLDRADLHKANVHLKTMEEVSEAFEAMQRAPITKRKDQLKPNELNEVRNTIMECIEAMTALTHYIAILCKEYCFSWFEMWKLHRKELKDKKYIN